MKFVRYGEAGKEKPGMIGEDGRLRDLSSHLPDITPEAIATGRLNRFASMPLETFETVSGTQRFGSPVASPGKIIAVGLNYADHASETKMAVPEEAILFSKAVTSLTGPNDGIQLPKDSQKTDWEVELALVIGKRAQYVSEQDAFDVIFGYSIMNDVSERAFQIETSGQWLKGKSFDTFAPLGPWLVTLDEIPDPHNLSIWLEVDGERMQASTTQQMIFKIPALIETITRYMTLEPGDIIATGTPAGVGMGRDPQVFLKDGNKVRLGIEGLGEQNQVVRAWKD